MCLTFSEQLLWGIQFVLGQLDDIHRQHFVSFGFLEFSCFGPAWYGAKCTRFDSSGNIWINFSSILFRPVCESHIFSNSESISKNLSLYWSKKLCYLELFPPIISYPFIVLLLYLEMSFHLGISIFRLVLMHFQ